MITSSMYVYVLIFFIGKIASKSVFNAHVINILSRTDRLASISRQLNEYGIPFEVHRAITPADLENEIIARRTKAPSSGIFHQETKLDFFLENFSGLRLTEIGCYQSHVQVLFQIAKNKTKSPVLILEDDTVFLPDFYNRTVDIMKRLPANWDIFHVGYCWEAQCHRLGPKTKDFCRIRRNVLYCTQAYFINGSRAASLALNVLNTEIPRVLDIVLYRSTSNYYASLPKLAKQFYGFGSDIGNPTSHWKEETRPKLKIIYKHEIK